MTQMNAALVPLRAARTLLNINDTTLTTVYLAACVLTSEKRVVTEATVSELVEDTDDTGTFHRSLAEELATLVLYGFMTLKEEEGYHRLVLTGRRRTDWDWATNGSFEDREDAMAELILKIDPTASGHAFVRGAEYRRKNAKAGTAA